MFFLKYEAVVTPERSSSLAKTIDQACVENEVANAWNWDRDVSEAPEASNVDGNG